MNISQGFTPSITVGGLTLSLGGLKILKGLTQTNGNSSFLDVSLGLGTRAAYVVPAGKTFFLYAVRAEIVVASAAALGAALMYADNNVGVDSATALTNPVGMLSGAAGAASRQDTFLTSQWSSSPQKEYAMGGSVPTGKYPTMVNISATGHVWLYGYEG